MAMTVIDEARRSMQALRLEIPDEVWQDVNEKVEMLIVMMLLKDHRVQQEMFMAHRKVTDENNTYADGYFSGLLKAMQILRQIA
jgi:hypothetical protein